MPRRQKVILNDIANRSNLTHAVYLAAKGKRSRASVQQFLLNLDQELNRLAQVILARSYLPDPLREFAIHDPKRRTIHAPSFRDRVLHHAVILQAGTQIDQTLIDDSFACRHGKGTIAAVFRAQHFSRRFPWFIKVDIAKYFHSIDHELLLYRLERRFKGAGFLELLRKIIGGFHSEMGFGRGLPIGALTSQYFANLYLNDADRWLISQSEVRGMVRYMDDIICWFDSNATARHTLAMLHEFLAEQLALRLNSSPETNRTSRGVSFCGHRIFPGTIRLTVRRKKLFQAAIQRWERSYLNGDISASLLQNGYASAFSIVKHADSLGWRRKVLEQHWVDEA